MMKRTRQEAHRKTTMRPQYQLDYMKARPNRFSSQLANKPVVLKTIAPSGKEQFKELLAEARAQAKEAGIKKSDLRAAVAKIRRPLK